jgi:hypothetical protein
MTDNSIYAWHFSTDELAFDMKGTKVEAGLTVSMDEIPMRGYKGFHACIPPLDALRYFSQRPNPQNTIIVSRVRLSGVMDIQRVDSNIAAQKREHLWVADAKPTIEAFGIWCYEESLRLLREMNYFIAPIFEEGLKARLENSDDLSAIIRSAKEQAKASRASERHYERIIGSLPMNLIEFTLANAGTYASIYSMYAKDKGEDTVSFPLVSVYGRSDSTRVPLQISNEKLHDMLMQLAPEGYHEPKVSSTNNFMTYRPIYAWHFSNGYLRFDYEGQKIEAGLDLETDAQPVPEKKGFHACTNPIHALRWFAVRPSSQVIVSRVRLSGIVIEDNSKAAILKGTQLVAQRRVHLWIADAVDTIKQLADYYLAERQRLVELYDALFEINQDIDRCIAYWNNKIISKTPREDLRHIREPQFFALEVIDAAKSSLSALCNRMAWQEAKADGYTLQDHIDWYTSTDDYYPYFDVVGEEDDEAINKQWLRELFLDEDFLLPPLEYRFECPIEFTFPDVKFHDMLMQLAPEGYRE